MRGLLLKDFMVLWKTYRNFLFIILIFIAVAVLGDNPLFFLYPAVLAGIFPASMVSVDEKEKWDEYSLTLPLSRKQFVSAKYLMGIICTLGIAAVMSLTWAVFLLAGRMEFHFEEIFLFIATAVFSGFFGSALSLPPIFKMGMEKGSIFYRAAIGVVFALIWFFVEARNRILNFQVSGTALSAGILAVSIVIYVFSWMLSVWFYQRREL